MKGQSDIYPQRFIQSVGKTQFVYNIVEKQRQDMDGSKTIFEWDYVEIEGAVTRSKLIDGILSKTYSKDAEIALINNELASPGTAEYTAYQELRQHAKEIAAEVLP